jgi:hypothetical protein
MRISIVKTSKEGAMTTKANITAFACVFLIGACGSSHSKKDQPKTEQEPKHTGIYLAGMVATTESIQTELVDKHCISCHSAGHKAGGLDLTDITTSISADDDIIVPKNPEKSEFYEEMEAGHMPPKGEPISPDSLAVVKAWIEALPAAEPTPGDDDPKPRSDDDPKPEEPIKVEATLGSIQSWVDHECVSCHDTATRDNREVDLTDISRLIMTSFGEPTSGIGGKIINPGKPLSSTFFTIMDPAFTRDPEKLMPKDEDPVAPEVLSVIKTWIEALPPVQRQDPCEVDPNSPECDVPVPRT